MLTGAFGRDAHFMFVKRFNFSYSVLLGWQVLLGEISEGGVLGLWEQLVVGNLERLVAGLGEALLQVVFDDHGASEVDLGHVESSLALNSLGHLYVKFSSYLIISMRIIF